MKPSSGRLQLLGRKRRFQGAVCEKKVPFAIPANSSLALFRRMARIRVSAVFFGPLAMVSVIAQSCNITLEQRWGDTYNSLDPKWSTVSSPSTWVWPANYAATPGIETDAVRTQLGICATPQANLSF